MTDQLKIDDKWAISYDPCNNDRPVSVQRHGEFHSLFSMDNVGCAMFYALLELDEAKAEIERLRGVLEDIAYDTDSDLPSNVIAYEMVARQALQGDDR